jgi:Uri superfamily endonuclease
MRVISWRLENKQGLTLAGFMQEKKTKRSKSPLSGGAGDPVVVLGNRDRGGAYILRFRLDSNLRVRLGRFKNGQQVRFEKGVYLYVGSAMGSWQTLGRRVARHASRSGTKRGHGIREEIVAVFGPNVLPKGEKHLRWHVDYVLERQAVEVTHVLAICSHQRMEGEIADRLLSDEETRIVAPGLGASDAAGKTHILRAPEPIAWWQGLSEQMRVLE